MPKGTKSCPKCNTNVGPRTKVCKCSHIFTFKEKKVIVSEKSTKIVEQRTVRNFVYAPASCPCPLTNIKNIKQWFEKVICLKSNNILYSRQAIISWILDSKIKEKQEAIKYVKEHMDEYPDVLYENDKYNKYAHVLMYRPRKKYV